MNRFTKKYEDLRFSDDFLFCKVLEQNPDLCRELLELALGRRTGKIVRVSKQEPVEITANGRGVRFDVYAEDDESTVYDVEMQNAREGDLPKRIRYSQSAIDIRMLERGERFEMLRNSYVIFICNFNPHPEHGLHRYTFENRCLEVPELALEDGTRKVFLCAKGTADDVPAGLQNFLSYVAGNEAADGFTERIERAAEKVRTSRTWRSEYMTFQEMLDIVKEDGREEGRAEERANTLREKKRADELAAELERLKKQLNVN